MATPGKSGKKEGRRPIPIKTSFSSPFSLQWNPLLQEDKDFILRNLMENLVLTGLEKQEVRAFRPWRKKKGASSPAESDSNRQCGWTDATVRRRVAVGINEVTKALERNELRLVLVCTSAKPKHMTAHLITLSASRGVPACQLPLLSQTAAAALGLKSVLALGFRGDGPFADMVDAIATRVSPPLVPWLQEGLADPEGGEQKTKGVKRKWVDDSEESSTSSTSSALQPLQVKKVVPNPAKKRDVKKVAAK